MNESTVSAQLAQTVRTIPLGREAKEPSTGSDNNKNSVQEAATSATTKNGDLTAVLQTKQVDEANAKSESLRNKLQQAEQLANDALATEKERLSISYDEPSGRFVYQSVNSDTGEVVSEYPPEDVLRQISKRLEARNSGEEAPKGIAIDKDF